MTQSAKTAVAADLKSEREKRKIPLAKIAADTRISLRHLESLEEGRYQDLPGGIYNRAFLKAYCESVNLDFEDIVRRYEAETSKNPERASKARIPAARKDSRKTNPAVVWGLMLLISVAGLFLARKWIAAVFSPYFSEQPVASVRFPPAQPLTAEKVSPEPKQAQVTAPTPELSAPGLEEALRLEIDAREQCWISVDRDGTRALSKILEPGEIQAFEAAEKFLIVVGNAGGVQLKINGRPAKPLGKSGEVVRIVIDRQSLQDLIAQNAG